MKTDELAELNIDLPDEDDLRGRISKLHEQADTLRKVLKLVVQIRGPKPPRSPAALARPHGSARA